MEGHDVAPITPCVVLVLFSSRGVWRKRLVARGVDRGGGLGGWKLAAFWSFSSTTGQPDDTQWLPTNEHPHKQAYEDSGARCPGL